MSYWKYHVNILTNILALFQLDQSSGNRANVVNVVYLITDLDNQNQLSAFEFASAQGAANALTTFQGTRLGIVAETLLTSSQLASIVTPGPVTPFLRAHFQYLRSYANVAQCDVDESLDIIYDLTREGFVGPPPPASRGKISIFSYSMKTVCSGTDLNE